MLLYIYRSFVLKMEVKKMSEVNLTAIESIKRLRRLIKESDTWDSQKLIFDLITFKSKSIPKSIYKECADLILESYSSIAIYLELYRDKPWNDEYRYRVSYEDEFSVYLFEQWLERCLHEDVYDLFEDANVLIRDLINLDNYKDDDKITKYLFFNLIRIMGVDCVDFLIDNVNKLKGKDYSGVIITTMMEDDLVPELFKHEEWYEIICSIDPCDWITISNFREQFIDIFKAQKCFKNYFTRFRDDLVLLIEDDKDLNFYSKKWLLTQLSSSKVLSESESLRIGRSIDLQKSEEDSLERLRISKRENLILEIKKEIKNITS